MRSLSIYIHQLSVDWITRFLTNWNFAMKFDRVDESFFFLRSILYSIKLVNKDYSGLLCSFIASFGRGSHAVSRSIFVETNEHLNFLLRKTKAQRANAKMIFFSRYSRIRVYLQKHIKRKHFSLCMNMMHALIFILKNWSSSAELLRFFSLLTSTNSQMNLGRISKKKKWNEIKERNEEFKILPV